MSIGEQVERRIWVETQYRVWREVNRQMHRLIRDEVHVIIENKVDLQLDRVSSIVRSQIRREIGISLEQYKN